MDLNKIKKLFNNAWINKICDDLMSPNQFIIDNKIQILETLLTAVKNSCDMSIPAHREYREAYAHVIELINMEVDKQITA